MKRVPVKMVRGKGMQYKLFAVDKDNKFVFGITFDDDVTSKQVAELKDKLDQSFAQQEQSK